MIIGPPLPPFHSRLRRLPPGASQEDYARRIAFIDGRLKAFDDFVDHATRLMFMVAGTCAGILILSLALWMTPGWFAFTMFALVIGCGLWAEVHS